MAIRAQNQHKNIQVGDNNVINEGPASKSTPFSGESLIRVASVTAAAAFGAIMLGRDLCSQKADNKLISFGQTCTKFALENAGRIALVFGASVCLPEVCRTLKFCYNNPMYPAGAVATALAFCLGQKIGPLS